MAILSYTNSEVQGNFVLVQFNPILHNTKILAKLNMSQTSQVFLFFFFFFIPKYLEQFVYANLLKYYNSVYVKG